MPIREYLCKDCNQFFDCIRSNTETEAEKCPKCGGDNTESQFTAHGGYSMNSGPASVRPKGAGSFKKGRK